MTSWKLAHLEISFQTISNSPSTIYHEQHLTSGECPTYANIMEKYEDLTDDRNLVCLFREILARREALDTAMVAIPDATGGRQPGGKLIWAHSAADNNHLCNIYMSPQCT